MKKRMTRALGLLVAVVLCFALFPVSAVAAKTYDEAKIPVFCYGPSCTADLLDADGNRLLQIDLTTGASTDLKVPFSDVGEFSYTLKLNDIDNVSAGTFFKQTEFEFYVDFYFYYENGKERVGNSFSSLDENGKVVKLGKLEFWEFEADSTVTPTPRPTRTPNRTTPSRLPQTGTNMWLVPLLLTVGGLLIFAGVLTRRGRRVKQVRRHGTD